MKQINYARCRSIIFAFIIQSVFGINVLIAQSMEPSNRVSIEISQAYFKQEVLHSSTSGMIEDWGDKLVLEWGFAREIKINNDDNQTVVIVPILDFEILDINLLDANCIFFMDKHGDLQMHIKMYQADARKYGSDELPQLKSFEGYLWEFYNESDTYSLFKVVNGNVISCGCSENLPYKKAVKNANSLFFQVVSTGCRGWKKSIYGAKPVKEGDGLWINLRNHFLLENPSGGSNNIRYSEITKFSS